MPMVTCSGVARSLVAVLLVTGLAVAGLVPAGATAADPASTLVVDPSDPTAYATIGEAVAAAHDGDLVLVRPGRYVESVVLDKAIGIEGDGDRAAILVEGPSLPAFHVLTDGASLRGLTLTGGRPLPEEGETVPPGDRWQLSCLALFADATATDLVIADGAATGIAVGDSATPTISDNEVHGNEWGIAVGDSATPTISDNEVHGNEFGIAAAEAAAPTVSGNVVHGNQLGIHVGGSATPTITDNLIHGNESAGIALIGSAAPTISDNLIHGNQFGIGVYGSAAPTISDNLIHGNELAGIGVGDSAAPTITDNDVHDNDMLGIGVYESAALDRSLRTPSTTTRSSALGWPTMPRRRSRTTTSTGTSPASTWVTPPRRRSARTTSTRTGCPTSGCRRAPRPRSTAGRSPARTRSRAGDDRLSGKDGGSSRLGWTGRVDCAAGRRRLLWTRREPQLASRGRVTVLLADEREDAQLRIRPDHERVAAQLVADDPSRLDVTQ